MPDKDETSKAYWHRDAVVACSIGAAVAIGVAVASTLLGQFSGAEAQRLVEAMIPTSRVYCSALLTVTSTILALMLTIVGLGKKCEERLSESHYHRIVKLAFYDSLLFALAAIFLLLHCIPVYESDDIPTWWYTTIYYGMLGTTSVLAGGAVTVISLLYYAVKGVIEVVGLHNSDHHLYSSPSHEETQD